MAQCIPVIMSGGAGTRLWHDVYDLDGQMQSVQVPASTLYHLWGGLMPVNEELASLCQTCQTQN